MCPPPRKSEDDESSSAPQVAEELARLREVTAQSTLNIEKRIRFLENKVNSFATLVPQLDKQVAALWEEASHTRSQINQQTEETEQSAGPAPKELKKMQEQIDSMREVISGSAAEPSPELKEVREGLATMRMQTKQQLDDLTALANNSTAELQDKVSRLDEQAARSVSQLRDEVTRLSNQVAAVPAQAAPAPGYSAEELAKLRDEWTEDMKRIVAKIGEVVTEDRNKIKHQIEETEKKLQAFVQQPTLNKEVIERTAMIQDEIQKLRNEVAASKKEVDDRVAGLKNTEEHSHVDLENTRKLLAQGQEQFNSRVENVQNAVANLQGLLTRDKAGMVQTAEDLRKEVNLIRVELKNQGGETTRKLDLFSKETEAGRQAIHNVSQVWDEIARLREETVKTRTQIEDRITQIRSGGLDVHTEIESTRQIIVESQNQFNARVESVQHTVEQLQRVIKMDKSDLTGIVDELKKEIDQARLDFGIKESNSLLHTSLEPVPTESGTPMLNEKEIEEAIQALSQLTDTP